MVTVSYHVPSLAAAIEQSEGGTEFVIQGAPDRAKAVAALQRGRDRVLEVGHPQEPAEPFLPFASQVTQTEGGAAFWADTKDLSAYPDIAAVVAAAVARGVTEVDCDGALIARRTTEQPTRTEAVLPAWFPMPPESVREREGPITGFDRTVHFKCWTLLSPDELLGFYRDVLAPAGFSLEVERNGGIKDWFRFGVTHAVFGRADGTIRLEMQTIEPHADASERDRRSWETDSPYATYTETWIRLNGLADPLEMEWVDGQWVRVSDA
jgi:hypothetical protein